MKRKINIDLFVEHEEDFSFDELHQKVVQDLCDKLHIEVESSLYKYLKIKSVIDV
jgi:hypothetical protein